jgi:hypothetical protein
MFQHIMLILFRVEPGQLLCKHVLSPTSNIAGEVPVAHSWSRRLVKDFHDTALVAAIVRAKRGDSAICHIAGCRWDRITKQGRL